jgi:hypothetical protein
MKNLYALLALVILSLVACVNTQKLINAGNYDEALRISVERLRKNKNKEKEILRLEQAFYKAQSRDLERITFLKKESSPTSSVEIYRIYEHISARQEMIKPLLPLYVDEREASFALLNVDDEIISWKKEAAGYLYSHAVQLLDRGDKASAREAYDELVELKGLYPNYRDVDNLTNVAWDRGMNWVAFKVENNSFNLVPGEFEYELQHTDLWPSTGKWYRFLDSREADSLADFAVVVNLKVVDVGPEQIKEVHYQESKEIKVGEKDLLDEKGQPVKDTAGNVIKVPILKEISAQVIETQQWKEALLTGSVEFYDVTRNRFVRSDPFEVRALFEHFSAIFSGNKDALKEETRRKIGNRPIPFPSDFAMIMDGADHLQPILINIIRNNTWVLEGT